MSTIEPPPLIPVVGIPSFRPYSNVQPFTVGNARTYLLQIETLIKWIRDTLVPHIDTEIGELTASWQEQTLAVLSAMEELRAEMIARIEVAEQTIGNAVTEAEAAKVAAETARDLAQMYAAGTAALQDAAVAALVEDVDSDTRAAITALLGGDNAVTELLETVNNGRLSEATLDGRFDGKASKATQDAVESGRLSEEALDAAYMDAAALDGGTPGQVFTRLSDGRGWADAFNGEPDPTERYTDWALSINPADFRAPVGQKLTIPTYLSPAGGEVVHPSVVYIPNGWNGYRYWMGYTPYPGGNDDAENPSIVASYDGVTWVKPDGLTNPIDLVTGTEYNSDTDLILAPDGKLYLFWRWDSNTGLQRMYVSSSSDGVNWSAKRVIHEANTASLRIVSASFIYEDGGLTCWGVDISNPSNRRLVRMRAEVANINAINTSSWSTPVTCTVSNIASGKQPWHFSIKNIDGLYVGILNDADTGANGSNGDIYLVTSSNGTAFTSGTVPITPKGNLPDHNQMYRATLVPEINGSTFGFRIWYSAWSNAGGTPVWNIFRTFATSLVAPNSDEASVTPVLKANRFTGTPLRVLTRTNKMAVLSFNGTLAANTPASAELIEIPVGFRNLSANKWFMGWNVSDATNAGSVKLYYDVATQSIRSSVAMTSSIGIAFYLAWNIEG